MFPKESEGKGKQLTNAQINIKKFRGFAGISAKDLDRAVGAKEGRTSDYELGKSMPGEEYLREVANVLDIKDWTILNKRLELNDLLEGAEAREGEEEPYLVPYWGLVPCGEWENPTHDPEKVPVAGRLKRYKDVIAVRATGESMKPLYHPGQLVPIRLRPIKLEGVASLIINEDRELSLKVARRTPGGDWEFHSINSMYGQVRGSEVSVLGHVVHVPEMFDPEGLRI